MKKRFLEAGDGQKSAKRLYGSILIILGITLHLITYYLSLFYIVNDTSTAVSIGNTFIGIGAGLLGLGIMDNIGIRKRDND